MSNQVNKITDVIQVMKSGVEFYREAASNIKTPNIIGVFQKMATEKQEAINALQPLAVVEKGEVETGSSWMVDSRKMYTKLLSSVTSDEEHTYVDQLEEVEDKVLEVLDEAIKEDQPPACMTVLHKIRARAQQLHDEMKALQKATS